jgi:hypothetical protein
MQHAIFGNMRKAQQPMASLKKTNRAIKSTKYAFVRLSKTEINDIIAALNILLDNEPGLFLGADVRIMRLRNRLQKLNLL